MDMLIEPGEVSVLVSPRSRGWSADELAQRLVDKIIEVADTAPPEIREQALEFQSRLMALCAYYLAEAQRSERTTLANKLRDAGLHDVARIVSRI